MARLVFHVPTGGAIPWRGQVWVFHPLVSCPFFKDQLTQHIFQQQHQLCSALGTLLSSSVTFKHVAVVCSSIKWTWGYSHLTEYLSIKCRNPSTELRQCLSPGNRLTRWTISNQTESNRSVPFLTVRLVNLLTL